MCFPLASLTALTRRGMSPTTLLMNSDGRDIVEPELVLPEGLALAPVHVGGQRHHAHPDKH